MLVLLRSRVATCNLDNISHRGTLSASLSHSDYVSLLLDTITLYAYVGSMINGLYKRRIIPMPYFSFCRRPFLSPPQISPCLLVPQPSPPLPLSRWPLPTPRWPAMSVNPSWMDSTSWPSLILPMAECTFFSITNPFQGESNPS